MTQVTEDSSVQIRLPVGTSAEFALHKKAGIIGFDTTSQSITACPEDDADYVRTGAHPDDVADKGAADDTDRLTVSVGGVQRSISVGDIRANLQPEDPDLTAIAALATAPYGRSLLEALNPAGGRSLLETISRSEFTGRTIRSALDPVYGMNPAEAQIAINAAMADAAVLTDTIVSAGATQQVAVTSEVFIPGGVYHLTGPIKYRNGVSIKCAGVGSVLFIVDFAGYGIEPYDAGAGTSVYYADIHISDCTFIQGAGNLGLGATKQVGMIRNCKTSNVRAFGFPKAFYFKDTWTNVLEQCSSYNSTGSHIYGDLGTGILTIRGGRFDECTGGGPGVFMNTLEGQLVMRDCAVQFGQGAAMELSCPNILLDTVFIEGNCISLTEIPQVAKYHIEATRPAFPNNPNSSFVMTNCVVNNRGNQTNGTPGPWRDGLGIVHVENFRRVEYRDCWVRNTILDVPVFLNCDTVECVVQSASDRTPSLSSVGPGLGGHVLWQQGNRPIGIFGQDMASDGSFAPTIRAAMNVGFHESGLALGTHNLYGAIQGYGTTGGRSNQVKINPWGGDVFFGSTSDARIQDGTNEVWARWRSVLSSTSSSGETPDATTDWQEVDCTSGNKSLILSADWHDPELYGAGLWVSKGDASANTLTISHATGGVQINGSATLVLSKPYESVLLRANGTRIIVLARTP